MEVVITMLEEGKESTYFLVVRDVFNRGNETISHGHVVGIGFADKADGKLRVSGTVTVQVDPYPFPPHVTPHMTLRQISEKEWHDLALDHTNR